MTQSRTRWSPFVVVLAVAAGVWFLHEVGARGLPAPQLTDLGAISTWLDKSDPITATFALLRLGGLFAGWYLLAGTALNVGAALTRLGGLRLLADALSITPVRRLAAGLVGLSMSAGAAAGSSGVVAAPSLSEPTIQRISDPDGSATLRRLPEGEAVREIHYDHRDPDMDHGDTAVLRRLPASDLTDRDQIPEEGGDEPGFSTWSVECGDHLWSVAEEVLADSWGRAPTDEEVTAFWTALIDANDLANPDLLFPAQTIRVPPPPPAPSG